MIDLLAGAIVLGLALGLPGVLLVRALAPELRGATLLIGGLAAGAAIVPTLAFGAAMALGTSMHPPLLLAVGAAIALPCAWRLRRR